MLFYLQFMLLLPLGGGHLSSGDSSSEQILLSQNFQICKNVDLDNSRLICEIHLLEMKWGFKHQQLQMFRLKIKKIEQCKRILK